MTTPYPTAHLIKEIGRGAKGARSLSQGDAQALYAAMLEGRVSDLELGAIMLALRIKGESTAEIAGFLEAAEASFPLLPAPPGPLAPVVIPTYNGARKMPNLTPLLACLLAREGVPTLVHGVLRDKGRVATAEIFEAMGLPVAGAPGEAAAAFARQLPCLMPIEALAPRLAYLLSLRRILGVRNSTHTLVKMMQPFACAALRLTSYTHPEYLTMLRDYFGNCAPAGRGDIFLMRGTEGETVANVRRAQQIEWFHAGVGTVLADKEEPTDALPDLPDDSGAAATAAWITEVLRGRQAVPNAIAAQVAHCVDVARALRA